MSVQRLTLVSELSPHTGYFDHTYAVFKELEKRGYYCVVRPLKRCESFVGVPADIQARLVYSVQPEDFELWICPPFHRPTPGKKVIVWTMWESTVLPAICVANLNHTELVLVPSQWCMDSFRASGVTRPMAIVPLGIDPELFTPWPMGMDGPTVFGTAGRLAHGNLRKGVNQVIQAFNEAFPDDPNVQLRVKCHPDCPVAPTNDPDRLTITRQHLSHKDALKWLQGLTAYVSGVTAEGWGFWQQQAMAVGRPVIGAVYGGLQMFMEQDTCYPVPYVELPGQELWTDGNWGYPRWDELIYRMREVHSNRTEARRRGRMASASARRYTWSHSVEALEDVFAYLEIKTGEPRYSPFNILPAQCSEPVQKPLPVQIHERGWDLRWLFPFDGGTARFNPGLVVHQGAKILAVREAELRNGDRVNNRIVLYGYYSLQRLGELLSRQELEDPRLYTAPDWRGEIQMWVSSVIIENRLPQQMLAISSTDGRSMGYPAWKPKYGRNDGSGQEKNWVWFHVDGTWHCIYTISPHVVFTVDSKFNVCRVYETPSPQWDYGQCRGGTPPVLVGDEYWCFFHSSLPWITYPDSGWRRRYFAGYYAFSAHAPYRITRFSKSPLLVGQTNDFKKLRLPHAVLFPGGSILEDEKWTVVMGVNDESCLAVTIPYSDLI